MSDSQQYYQERLNRALEKADTAFAGNDFQDAESHYIECIGLFERERMVNSFEYATCLFNLGKVYQLTNRHAQAIPLFARLIEIEDRGSAGRLTPRTVQTAINLSQCHLKCGSLRDAERVSFKAMSLANGCLPPNHPLVFKILESQIALMKQARQSDTDIERANQFLDDVKAGKKSIDEFEDYIARQPTRVATTSSFDGEVLDMIRAPNEPITLRQREALQSKPEGPGVGRIIALVAFILVVLGGTTAGIIFMQTGQAGKIAKKVAREVRPVHNPLIGQKFQSVDREKQLAFIDGKNAEWKVEQIYVGSPYLLASELVPEEIPKARFTVEKVGAAMQDEDGTRLYTTDSGEHLVANQMRLVAEAAKKYYLTRARWPDDAASLELLDPKILYRNPFTQKVEEPLCFNIDANKVGKVSARKIAQDAIAGKSLVEEQEKRAGCVGYYLYPAPEGLLAIVRGCDAEGNFLTSGMLRKRTYTLILLNGYEWTEAAQAEKKIKAEDYKRKTLVVQERK